MLKKNKAKNPKLSGSLALKLTLMVFFASSLIFLCVFLYDYYFSHQYVIRTTETHASDLARGTVDQIEKKLARIESAAKIIALAADNKTGAEEDAKALIIDTLKANPDIFSLAVVVDSQEQDGFAPYFYRKNGELVYADLARKDYNYRDKKWYQKPMQAGAPLWTEPYYPTGGSDELMCTYSVPIYLERQGKQVFAGVVTADIGLDWLSSIISSLNYFESGFAFLISGSGTFISHPVRQYEINESLQTLSDKTGNSDLEEIGRAMTDGKTDRRKYSSPVLQKQAWVFYEPFANNAWSLGLVIPHDELFSELRQQTVKQLGAGAAGFLLLALAIMLVVKRFVRPIRALAESTGNIAQGNLDIEIPKTGSRDEIGRLSDSFDNMRLALKEYIHHLKETTAAKEKIESELKIAHRIQMSFLPQQIQLEPAREEFELSADIEPAREVGGDLYDFFLIDEDHLFIAIGDVSDKGVPAALFMAVTKTLMKGAAETGRTPADILSKVNAELGRDNESMMFVTLFCGILNLKTGELKYSNAGHNPPVVFPPGLDTEWLELPPGLVLGVAEEAEYFTRSTNLPPGAMLLLYTDGVTEAMDKHHRLYGEERLMEVAARSAGHRPARLIEGIIDDVHRHSGDESQSDDITLLAIRYSGKS